MSPKVAAPLLALALLGASCSGDTPEPKGQADPVTEVIVQQGDRLRAIDIQNGEIRDIGPLPSDDVAVSPDGTTVAYTEPGRHNGTLFLAGLEDLDAARKVGPGMSPVFSPDGEAVAAITVDPNYNICPAGTQDPTNKECVFGESIDVYPVAQNEGAPATALGANVWNFIGWTADDQILAGSDENGYLALGFAGAAFEEVQQFTGFHPDSVFGVSPNDIAILFQNPDGIATQTLDATQAVTIPLNLPPATKLIDASWSPDGTRIALIAAHRAATEAFAVTTADGSVEELGSASAGSGLAWSDDGEATAFIGGSEQTREIIVCIVDEQCRSVSGGKGATVLGLH